MRTSCHPGCPAAGGSPTPLTEGFHLREVQEVQQLKGASDSFDAPPESVVHVAGCANGESRFVEALALPEVLSELESLGRRARVERLAERIGRIRSPLELVTVLAPVGKGLWKDRIGDHRLIAVTHRTRSDDWQLVFVDFVKRDTGDVNRGAYRLILDGKRDREYHLNLVREQQGELARLVDSGAGSQTARVRRTATPGALSPWFGLRQPSSRAEVAVLGRGDWARGLPARGDQRAELANELLRAALHRRLSVGELGRVELGQAELMWLELPGDPFRAERAVLFLDTRPTSLGERPPEFSTDVEDLRRHLASLAGSGRSFDGSRLRGLADWIYSVDQSHPLEELEIGSVSFDPELLLQLDDEQVSFLDGALDAEPPLFLTGRAGSSKSTLLHHAFAGYCLFAARSATEGEPRFVTRSSRLLDEARVRVRVALQTQHHLSGSDAQLVRSVEQRMSTLADHFRARLPADALTRFAPEQYMSFDRFQRLYNSTSRSESPEGQWTLPNHGIRRDVSAATAWFIIRALIKGFDPARDPGSKDTSFRPDDYAELPRGDEWVSPESFGLVWKSVYHDWYRPLMDAQRLWDDQDLARAVLDAGQYDFEVPVTALVCDEAQDLTRVEILALCSTSALLRHDLTHLKGRSLPILLAGDEVQTLHPTAFRWDTVTSAFYELTRSAFGGIAAQRFSEKDLILNYRSAPEIVAVANAVQRLRRSRLAESSASEQSSRLTPTGHPASAFAIPVDMDLETLQAALLTNTVLVPCDEGAEREYVRQDDLLTHAYGEMYGDWLSEDSDTAPPIYGPHEAKGLEFRSVILYDWGGWAPHPNEISGEGDRQDSRARYAKLYTAITRATHRLAILERSEEALALWRDIASEEPTGRLNHPLIDFRTATQLGGLAQDAQDFARELAERGRRVESSSEMRRADASYTAIGMATQADLCRADGLRFDEQFLAAAELYEELSEHEQASDCLWRAEAFERLIRTPDGTVRSKLRKSAARILVEHQPGAAALEELALTLAELTELNAAEGTDSVSDRALRRLVDECDQAIVGGDSWPCRSILPLLATGPLAGRVQLIPHASPLVGAIRWCIGGRAEASDIVAQLQASYAVTSARQAVLSWLVLQIPEEDPQRVVDLLRAVYAENQQDALVVELQSLRRSDPASSRAGSLVESSLDRLATSVDSLVDLVVGGSSHGNQTP